jgi:RNA polymerase sigma-70 factor (ECF subfamily)
VDPSPHPPPDERAERFRRIFDRHHGQVLRYAQRRSSTHAAAEDVAAETFLVVWRRLDDVPRDPATRCRGCTPPRAPSPPTSAGAPAGTRR